MDIKAWFANLLSPKAVSESQSNDPKLETLRREFAAHHSKGLTPAKLAAIFIEAEQGSLIAQAELFRDMEEKDPHLAADLSKRKMAVKQLDWSLKPPRNASELEKKNTRLLEDLIRDEVDISSVRFDLMDAIGHGYACVELGWKTNHAGLWFPNMLELREPSWFVTPLDNRNTLHLRDISSPYGVPLQPWGWIPHIHKTRSGYIARSGLFRVLAWPYLFKNYAARDLAEFLEIYGLPIRIGKYPMGADDKQKRDLMRAILSIGHNAAGIIPDSMQMELLTMSAGGNADSFKVMMDWCEQSISKAILGGTLTSQTGANGNFSLGKVHNEVRLDIRDDDAQQLDQSFSLYLLYPMAMLNGLFADNRCPTFVSDYQEPEDLSLYADALPKLVGIGAQIPLSFVNNKLKIPTPDGNEPVLTASTAAPALNPVPASNKKALNALAGSLEVDSTPVTAMTERLAAEAAPHLADWLEVIRQKVDKAEGLDALRNDLLNSYADLEAGELVKVFSVAFAAADLAGRFDVQKGY